ncbi:anaerobic ribonucleoside-triphosphate reductase [Sporomusa sp.]|uniref:anaerobic ribonucleoside-triphosphate reductase n=1 Tax=Sporomusa sp. TaxID=2078658 RepID=UPI002CF7917B|nr:anaerobic ribonucleoside-triphosphate reductase [Sporomusa sp.]HWR42068.1 anaerobic ribonucleoside-triphosphate reductase [Sporomusa sp.]
MIIEGVKVVAEPGITEEEIRSIVEEEIQLWDRKGKELGEVQLKVEGDEIVVKAAERSPIKRVRRITGYLSTEDRFNSAKQAELSDRRSHL